MADGEKKKGTRKLKLVKKGSAASGSDDREKSVELHAKELAERAAGGDLDALKAMEKIVVSFERWKKALFNQASEGEACRKLVGTAESVFANKVEEAMPEDATAADWPMVKLRGIEVSRQDLCEAKSERDERMTTARDVVKKWGSALERAMRDGAQLTIPGTD